MEDPKVMVVHFFTLTKGMNFREGSFDQLDSGEVRDKLDIIVWMLDVK